jgi:hypothetical protein
MTPSQRVALAIEISRAALRFAQAKRVLDDTFGDAAGLDELQRRA